MRKSVLIDFSDCVIYGVVWVMCMGGLETMWKGDVFDMER